MKTIKKVSLLFLLVLGLCNHALGNMRAPRTFEMPPSSSLKISQIEEGVVPVAQLQAGLLVQQEDLMVDCTHAECTVDATYHITSESLSPLLVFEFMLPMEVPAVAMVNGKAVQTEAIAEDGWREQIDPQTVYFYGWRDHDSSTNKVLFSAPLLEGDNTIQVQYTQPLSLFEQDYGYFKEGRFVGQFVYILSPLKEWRMADDFVMNVQISSSNQRPEGFSFFKKREMRCALPEGKLIKDDEKIIYQYQLGKEFTDLLVCVMGDRDLLPKNGL